MVKKNNLGRYVSCSFRCTCLQTAFTRHGASSLNKTQQNTTRTLSLLEAQTQRLLLMQRSAKVKRTTAQYYLEAQGQGLPSKATYNSSFFPDGNGRVVSTSQIPAFWTDSSSPDARYPILMIKSTSLHRAGCLWLRLLRSTSARDLPDGYQESTIAGNEGVKPVQFQTYESFIS